MIHDKKKKMKRCLLYKSSYNVLLYKSDDSATLYISIEQDEQLDTFVPE